MDNNVEASELTVTFSSDKDGTLGQPSVNTDGSLMFVTDQLSNNTHIIYMMVEDEIGASCQDSIVINVGTPPIVEIIEPQNGDVFTVGSNIYVSRESVRQRRLDDRLDSVVECLFGG